MTPAELPLPPPQPEPDYRDMLVRTIGLFLEGYGESAGIPADVRAWWEDGPLQEYEQAWRRRKALEDLERARRKLHEAEAEVLKLEAT